MVQEMFEKGIWVGNRNPLDSAWLPYIDGQRSLSEAATGLIEALKAPGQ